jgi:hypothetical protein
MSMPSSNWSESLIPLLRRNKYFNSETSQLAVDTMHGGFSQMPYGLIMFQTKLGIPIVIKPDQPSRLILDLEAGPV